MKVYRIQIRNFGAVAWRMYDKKEYSEKDAITLVAKLNQVDEIHCYRKVFYRTVEDAKNGIVDESGARRYTMTVEKLQTLYKDFENFVADCTEAEYKENKESITAVYALIHKHINEGFKK